MLGSHSQARGWWIASPLVTIMPNHALHSFTGGLRPAYAWRPILPSGCTLPPAQRCLLEGTGGPVVLPGYGVEMAIKNMEYNARDDSKVISSGGSGMHRWVAE